MVTNNEREHRFETEREGQLAFQTYHIGKGVIALLHTEVLEPISGHGIAAEMTQAAFDYARAHRLRVKIYCPYVATWLKGHPEQRDIVAES